MANKNYFINGITELLILYLLNQKDCYVYEHIEPEGRKYLEELMATYNTTIAGVNKVLKSRLGDNEDESPKTKE